jgi:hypothetical protein
MPPRIVTARKESAVAFTARAIDWFARHGMTVERIMTDNGFGVSRPILSGVRGCDKG